jgi:hypothetical protein
MEGVVTPRAASSSRFQHPRARPVSEYVVLAQPECQIHDSLIMGTCPVAIAGCLFLGCPPGALGVDRPKRELDAACRMKHD